MAHQIGRRAVTYIHAYVYQPYERLMPVLADGQLEFAGEYDRCLQEAALITTGHRLRELFVTILAFCTPTNPEILWEKYKKYLYDDLLHKIPTLYGIKDPTEEQVLDYGLYVLEKMLIEEGTRMEDLGSMPQYTGNWSNIIQTNQP